MAAHILETPEANASIWRHPVTSAVKRCHSGHLHSLSVPLAFSGKKPYVVRVTQTNFAVALGLALTGPRDAGNPRRPGLLPPGRLALPGNASSTIAAIRFGCKFRIARSFHVKPLSLHVKLSLCRRRLPSEARSCNVPPVR